MCSDYKVRYVFDRFKIPLTFEILYLVYSKKSQTSFERMPSLIN